METRETTEGSDCGRDAHYWAPPAQVQRSMLDLLPSGHMDVIDRLLDHGPSSSEQAGPPPRYEHGSVASCVREVQQIGHGRRTG